MTSPYSDPKSSYTGLVRPAHILNVSMILAMFVTSLLVYEQLPERIPIHFDSAGVANGWTKKSLLTWLLFSFSGLGMTLIFYGSSWLVKYARKSPRLLNIPMKQQFLKLPTQAQEPIWNIMRAMTIWLAVPTNALFLYIIIATSSVADQDSPVLPSWPVFVFVTLEIGMTLAWLIKLYRSIRNAVHGRIEIDPAQS